MKEQFRENQRLNAVVMVYVYGHAIYFFTLHFHWRLIYTHTHTHTHRPPWYLGDLFFSLFNWSLCFVLCRHPVPLSQSTQFNSHFSLFFPLGIDLSWSWFSKVYPSSHWSHIFSLSFIDLPFITSSFFSIDFLSSFLSLSLSLFLSAS